MASPRRVRPAAQGFLASHTRAARAIRRRLVALIEIAATSMSARALTSTKAIAPPLLRDEVDFAAGDDKPARENPIALEAKHERGDRFRLETKKMGAAPALGPLGAARAAHRAAPASASARA